MPAMCSVWAFCTLCELQEFEDRNQLAGYIMMMNGSYDHAQDLFMKSSDPKLALEVTRLVAAIAAIAQFWSIRSCM